MKEKPKINEPQLSLAELKAKEFLANHESDLLDNYSYVAANAETLHKELAGLLDAHGQDTVWAFRERAVEEIRNMRENFVSVNRILEVLANVSTKDLDPVKLKETVCGLRQQLWELQYKINHPANG